MHTTIKRTIILAALLIGAATTTQAADWNLPITVASGGARTGVVIGISDKATNGYDNGYDAQNRQTSVTTDLTPADNAIADGKTFVTTYTYDGTSTRVTSISENGQPVASFTYVLVGTGWKVATFTDGEGRVNTVSYAATTQTTTTSVNLVSSALATPTPAWSGSTLLETSTSTTSATNAQTVFSSTGSGLAIWIENNNLSYTTYNKSTNVCQPLPRHAARRRTSSGAILAKFVSFP